MKILTGYVEDTVHSGIDRYLLSVLDLAKKEGVTMDFLTSRPTHALKKTIGDCGARLFAIHNLKKPWKHYRDVKKILSEGGYDRAYFNVSEPLNLFGALAAHRLGIFTVIHSHSSGIDVSSPVKRRLRALINWICRPWIRRLGDRFFACSDTAGRWLFGKKIVKSDRYFSIFNAVDPTRFFFDEEDRRTMRAQLQIAEEEKVLLFVGHFCYAKNCEFLAPILFACQERGLSCRLLLVGDGEKREETAESFTARGISDLTSFLGVRRDVDRLMRAADLFLLPSRFEGLPLVAVEAQMSGLSCLISDRVDPSVCVCESCRQIPIDNAEVWAREIEKILSVPPNRVTIPTQFTLSARDELLRQILFS